MNFLKNILSTLVALIIFSVVSILIFVAVIGSLADEPPVEVKSNSVLHLKLDKPISEVEFDNQLESLEFLPSAPSTIGLVQLKEAIVQAKTDEKIKGIYLDAPYVMAGMAVLQELREALVDFKSSGKFIVAYGEFYTEPSYYLVSVADQVFLHPEGDLEFNGLGANVTFFKGMFEKLDIEPQIFRVGEFKSAVEPFIRKDLSQENKLQINEMLSSINSNLLDSISTGRNISSDRLKAISDGMEVRNPQDAMALNLVDSLYYFDQVMSVLKQNAGIEEDKEIEFIKYNKYNKSYSNYKKADSEIAVIVASGDIVSGKGDVNTIGSENFSKEIRKARKNDKIKAIVLRINSPGGSFLASDVMWREIKLAAAEKPVIASMSDLAASGGYYMAMACDTIIAQPTTITGSIGIFGMLFNAKGFLNNKLGITHDEVATGEYSNYITMTRPLTDQERRIIQNDVEKGYETFITKAAEGRGMSVEAIKSVASGRVWTGIQAKERGLVDMLGDLEDAIAVASEKAGVSEYRVRYYPKQRSLIDQIMQDLEGESSAKVLESELGEYYNYVEQVRSVQRMNGLQAKWPFELEIN
ncbi:signal peptide peptidase SppA [Fulvivirga sp. RKSG066]|uniref:signal peptide peptidase SppA n=1 Tax=Fulvivirga aurantia TaxID=2529383 RepID=UPI0012BCC3A5|nr:signal peptide peptidase SppA [Fulvivirga aurantia]MTI22174.1 signal peptide peptidase SppA [Fulvivirga aurantia]